MSVKYLKKNAQTLNINTILYSNPRKKYGGQNNKYMTKYRMLNKFSNGEGNKTGDYQDLMSMNNVVNNNISPKYKIIKYLGEGIQGSLYLAVDKKNNRYICKKIILEDDKIDNPNVINASDVNNPYNANTNNTNTKEEKHKQIQFELNVLNYLSNNATTREHINPCLEYKIFNNNVYTIFPVFDGYSLNYLKKHLLKLSHTEYYNLAFHLIKIILHGMAKIHKTHVAHQNINENAILVSSFNNPNELYVKFTDFGLGCGYINSGVGNIMSVKDYQNDKYFKLATCKANSNIPLIISDDIVDQLSQSEYLQLSQKYDLLCLGMIFLKLLLVFDNLDIDLSSGYNKLFIEKIKQRLVDKYISKINNDKVKYDDIFPLLNIPVDMKKNLLEYIKLLVLHVFCKTNSRKTCQYLLDKMIIYEKYKNDIF
jgi:serine/threonine protein kinase